MQPFVTSIQVEIYYCLFYHYPDPPSSPMVLPSSHCTMLAEILERGSRENGTQQSVCIAYGDTLNPQSLLQLIPKRRAPAKAVRCAARDCICFPRPLPRYCKGSDCTVGVSSRRSHSSCIEGTPVHIIVGTWCLDYEQSAPSSSHLAM